jgi:carbamoyltransferase
LKYVLGISAYYHDSAACLLKDGEIVAATQEERFTRVKQDARFPTRAVAACLEFAGITVDDLDEVAFYEQPRVKFDRLLKTYLAFAPKGLGSFLAAMPVWLKDKLRMESDIRRKLGYGGRLHFPLHHESHAASAFFPSPFEKAAVLTLDGVGEWTTTSFGVGRSNTLSMMKEIRFPHSLGLLYSAFTYYTGFKVNSGEYKMMGLAPYGDPKYVDVILDNLLDLKEDGSFRLDMSYFNYCTGFTMTSERFHRLFGQEPRKPESEITQFEMDLASSIQAVTEEIVLRIGRHLHETTGEKHLCMAGGVALNCVANGRLLREGPFESIWIQPAAGDAGGALGAALHVWHQVLGNERVVDGTSDLQKGSYLGPEYSPEAIRTFLESGGYPYTTLEKNELPERVADLLVNENVVGWFQGRMEFGPRALGGRSILGDPRSSQMQSTMNLKIKYRESFRPFAPAVLYDHCAEWFDLNPEQTDPAVASPYMLLVGDVHRSKRLEKGDDQPGKGLERLKTVRSEIPAVTHVDYSARVETIHKETNPPYHDLAQAFHRKTGCPVLINTSFNVRGEPIVASPEDAYKCFMRTEMDYLVLGSFLLKKEGQPEFVETRDWREEFALD